MFIISIGNKLDNRLENLCYLTREEHHRLHMTGNKHNLGKKRGPLSEEHKEKIRDSKKKKQVYCVQLDRVFAGVRIAAQELSLYYGNIIKCCQGKRKTIGGYHWQYLDEVKNEQV